MMPMTVIERIVGTRLQEQVFALALRTGLGQQPSVVDIALRGGADQPISAARSGCGSRHEDGTAGPESGIERLRRPEPEFDRQHV